MKMKHAVEYVIGSGKVTEVYLTPGNMNLLKKNKKARLKVKGNWLVINPQMAVKKTAQELKIEQLEQQLRELKNGAKKSKKLNLGRWQGKSKEEIKRHMAMMSAKRIANKQGANHV